MGQKVNPTGLRVGVNRTWDSVWYEEKKQYSRNLHEDLAIQRHVQQKHKLEYTRSLSNVSPTG